MSNISLLTAHDSPRLHQIELSGNMFPWKLSLIQSCFSEHYRVFGIHCNNQLVGYCIWHLVLNEATLMNIVVHKAKQGQGLAKQLLNYCFDYLSRNAIDTLWLEVRESNNQAIHLYNKTGFSQVDIRKNYYKTDIGKEDAIIMQKVI
ncbi:ribosomal-protein-alanine N-acetyltransferase [Saccharobesus litoralis]|uniref:[Ribosomal protein bS18]-alanine N-acetyltransferase n=1 Tax=Saccharobesus litoralis TaxID=2172099 RepID=A0A2S0VM98_9ALTE|nr:ribosomal protein S18-alanine N-acetyltransferase [Saccharobesus litoralis]AWB65338.1 ribosomal-protein-alanine N-acetyltransferase [Saccharobesus litoralis]